jgi:hypothetical protein
MFSRGPPAVSLVAFTQPLGPRSNAKGFRKKLLERHRPTRLRAVPAYWRALSFSSLNADLKANIGIVSAAVRKRVTRGKRGVAKLAVSKAIEVFLRPWRRLIHRELGTGNSDPTAGAPDVQFDRGACSRPAALFGSDVAFFIERHIDRRSIPDHRPSP